MAYSTFRLIYSTKFSDKYTFFSNQNLVCVSMIWFAVAMITWCVHVMRGLSTSLFFTYKFHFYSYASVPKFTTGSPWWTKLNFLKWKKILCNDFQNHNKCVSIKNDGTISVHCPIWPPSPPPPSLRHTYTHSRRQTSQCTLGWVSGWRYTHVTPHQLLQIAVRFPWWHYFPSRSVCSS